MSNNPFLIDPQDLVARLGSPGVAVVDASWYLPTHGRNPRAEFEAAHVPGAVFFDQDAVVEPGSNLPHTLPKPDVFAEAAGRLGLSETDTIVVYDGLGLFSAPRVWWMFRTFGVRDVRILHGGFPAWREAELPIESGPVRKAPKPFAARFSPDAVVDFAAMRHHVDLGDIVVADARSVERFAGDAPEPRAGVRSGHMPGARSLPHTALVENGRLKPADALRRSFVEAGIDPDAPVVTSCGSGITAAVINLALESVGNRRSRLYDGSWTEWGSASDTPVATGPAGPAASRR